MRALLALGVLVAVAACGGGGEAAGGPPARPSSADVATGVVHDGSGAPVGGVLVAAASLDVPAQAVPELAVVSDAAGRYAWPAVLAPGRYALRAETADGPAVAELTVSPGTVVPLDLHVRR